MNMNDQILKLRDDWSFIEVHYSQERLRPDDFLILIRLEIEDAIRSERVNRIRDWSMWAARHSLKILEMRESRVKELKKIAKIIGKKKEIDMKVCLRSAIKRWVSEATDYFTLEDFLLEEVGHSGYINRSISAYCNRKLKELGCETIKRGKQKFFKPPMVIAVYPESGPSTDSISLGMNLREWVLCQDDAFTIGDAIKGVFGLSEATMDLNVRVGIALRWLGCKKYARPETSPRYWYKRPVNNSAV